jgi:hypothetical protein
MSPFGEKFANYKSICKAPEGFGGLDLSKGSCGEVPSVAQGVPS